MSAVEGPARSAEQLPGALEYGAAGPDGAGLESWLLETEDERIGPVMLDEAARGPGGDGATASGSRGAKCDPVAASLLTLDNPISGVCMKHRGVVAPAEEERLEIWKEGADEGEVELHAGSLT
jgi:hypothetical protein